MEKCWFVLKPPPKSGICLGHIIPDLTNLDNIINRGEEGIKFTPSVPVCHAKSWDLDRERDTDLNTGLAAGPRARIRARESPSTKEQTQLAFERTVKNYNEHDTLDQYVIDTDREFIHRILEHKAVAARIEHTKGVQLFKLGYSWSVFMITGIIIARGAKGKPRESGIFEAMPSTAANVADEALIGVEANSTNQNNTSLPVKTPDFVWAVQLQKIWKDATAKWLFFKAPFIGATAGLGNKKPWRDELQDVLIKELSAVGTFQTLDLPDEQGMIVCLNSHASEEGARMSLTTNGGHMIARSYYLVVLSTVSGGSEWLFYRYES